MKSKQEIPEPIKLDNNKFQCQTCKTEWKNYRGYRLHYIRKHTKNNGYTTKNFKKTEPQLSIDNMTVNICPKCHCRFATMIMD